MPEHPLKKTCLDTRDTPPPLKKNSVCPVTAERGSSSRGQGEIQTLTQRLPCILEMAVPASV